VRLYVLALFAIVATACPYTLFSQTATDSSPANVVTADAKLAPASAMPAKGAPTQLTLKKTISLRTAPITSLGAPGCDATGNFYLPNHDSLTISKFNTKGEQVATFKANSSPDVPLVDHIGRFAATADGEVYQLVFPHSYDRDVFLYNKDGSYKSKIKLDAGGVWLPNLFVAIPSGNFLATGHKWNRTAKEYGPFTGIFSSDGSLLKELQLEDDAYINQQRSWGDSRFTLGPGQVNSSINFAISRGEMKLGDDGNVYLLRWLNPAVIYAISPGGEIVRRFTVDPGDPELTVGGMAVAGGRIAVVFRKGREGENVEQEIIKVVDLEGNKVATYGLPMVDGHAAFGISLACYSHNPEQFTFLDWTKDEKLVLNITEPQ
jgi:hypothetical protein